MDNKVFNSMFGNSTGEKSSSTTFNVSKGDHVTSGTTYQGSNVTINNYGIMDTMVSGKNSHLVLNNYGKVNNEIRIGENGTAVINNFNEEKDPVTGNYVIGINKVTGEKNSKINAFNYGGMGEIHTGDYSKNEIWNMNEKSYLNWLKTGYGNSSTTDERTKKRSGQGTIEVVSDLDKLKYNLYQLGYRNVYKDYTSARDQFLNDYYDHGRPLKVDFQLLGTGEFYSTLLEWTNLALGERYTNSIAVAAQKDAREQLDRILGEKHGIWAFSYTYDEFSYSLKYFKKYSDTQVDLAGYQSVSKILDIFYTKGDTDFGIYGPIPFVSSFAIEAFEYACSVLLSEYDPQPGVTEVSEIIDPFGYYKDAVLAEMEMKFVNETEFKYLIDGGSKNKFRDDFVKELQTLKQNLAKQDIIYGSEDQSRIYKNEMIAYIDLVINENLNYKDSVNRLDKYFENIEKELYGD